MSETFDFSTSIKCKDEMIKFTSYGIIRNYLYNSLIRATDYASITDYIIHGGNEYLRFMNNKLINRKITDKIG